MLASPSLCHNKYRAQAAANCNGFLHRMMAAQMHDMHLLAAISLLAFSCLRQHT
jgi:hypothetical protein